MNEVIASILVALDEQEISIQSKSTLLYSQLHMTQTFVDKVVLITGGSSGLGRTLAIDLSEKGAKIAIMGRKLDSLNETKRLCKNGKIFVIQGDVADKETCEKAISSTYAHFGRIDYLILNAGITMWSRVEELEDPDVLKSIMDTNYLGAAYCAFYALPYLKKVRGMIVAISSTQGKIPVPYHAGYTASKHAMDAFFSTLRSEIAPSVSVLIVSPGWIRDTLLKKNAAVTHSNISPLQTGMSPAHCSHQIIKAMAKRQRELMLPFHYRFLPILRLLFPRLFDWSVKKFVRSD